MMSLWKLLKVGSHFIISACYEALYNTLFTNGERNNALIIEELSVYAYLTNATLYAHNLQGTL